MITPVIERKYVLKIEVLIETIIKKRLLKTFSDDSKKFRINNYCVNPNN